MVTVSMTHDHQDRPHFVIRVHFVCQWTDITDTCTVPYTLCMARLMLLHCMMDRGHLTPWLPQCPRRFTHHVLHVTLAHHICTM